MWVIWVGSGSFLGTFSFISAANTLNKHFFAAGVLTYDKKANHFLKNLWNFVLCDQTGQKMVPYIKIFGEMDRLKVANGAYQTVLELRSASIFSNCRRDDSHIGTPQNVSEIYLYEYDIFF